MFARFPFPVPRRTLSAMALVLPLLSPGPARAVSADSSLGVPSLFVVIGEIPPPFVYRFNLEVAPSAWPSLIHAKPLVQAQVDALGELNADTVYSSQSPRFTNSATANARLSGVYYPIVNMSNNIDHPGYNGTFAYTQWSQSFVKDSANSTCSFFSSYSGVRARAAALDTARAEFALWIGVSSNGNLVDHFSQKSGVIARESNGFDPTVFETWFVGSMPVPAPYDPSGIGVSREYDFAPYGSPFDLSSVAVGDTFSVTCMAMCQSMISDSGELPGGYAAFLDPVGGGGVAISKHACTAVDGQPPELLGAPNPAPPGTTRLSAPWPNPARGQVFLTLDLARAGRVRAVVYDVAGREVGTVADADYAAGRHLLQWAPDRAGPAPPAGVYFVRVHGPGVSQVRRVVRVTG